MAPLELLFRELDAGRALVSTISMSIVAHAGTIIVTDAGPLQHAGTTVPSVSLGRCFVR